MNYLLKVYTLLFFVEYIFSDASIIKSDLNEMKYNTEKLSNGIDLLTINTDKYKNSACAISIKTGGYNDTIPGIAHFLEHMLFMGTTKYPEENSWLMFVQNNNGNSNAFTNEDTTVFYFDIDSNFFIDALDRFAEFFKNPLFNENSLEKEICAVESEFLSKVTNETNRIRQLVNIFSIEPYSNFIAGNKTSLLSKNGSHDNLLYAELREEVIKFWKDNYDSNTMKLVILHDGSIQDKIKEFFEPIFSIHKKNILPDIETNHSKKEFTPSLYNMNYTNKFIFVKPYDIYTAVVINIEIPNDKFAFKNNIINYLKYLLLSKHEKSLIYKYKKMNLAKQIFIDIIKNSYISNVEITILPISYDLTNIIKIINIFYKYLFIMVYSDEEYNLYKNKFQMDFKYEETIDPLDHVKNLAINMQYYPTENIMNYNYIYEHFDKNELEKLLDILKQYENWLIFIISNDYFDNITSVKTEKHYKVKYNITSEMVIKEKYHGPYIVQNFFARELNIFQNLGTSLPFKLYDKQSTINTTNFHPDAGNKIFKKIHVNENSNFTFLNNTKYKTPKSCVSIRLNTEITKNNYIKTYLYLKMANELYLEKYGDYFFLKSVDFKYEITKMGITFEFCGYTDYIISCVWNYFSVFLNIDRSYFTLVKNDYIQTYDDISIESPKKTVFDTIENEILNFLPSYNDYLARCNKMNSDTINLNHEYYLEMFICSTTSPENFLILFNHLCKEIVPANKFEHHHFFTKTMFKRKTIDEKNNAVGIFLKNKPITDHKSVAITKMILPYFNEMFFNQLRTKEQLGYVVKMNELCINKINYIYFIIQSEKDCNEIISKILNFISRMKNELLNLNSEVFSSMKNNFIKQYSGQYGNLESYFEYYKSLYYNDVFDFNYNANMINSIHFIEQKDLILPDEIIIIKVKKKPNGNRLTRLLRNCI